MLSHQRRLWRLCVEPSKEVMDALCRAIKGGYGGFVLSHQRRLWRLCVEPSKEVMEALC